MSLRLGPAGTASRTLSVPTTVRALVASLALMATSTALMVHRGRIHPLTWFLSRRRKQIPRNSEKVLIFSGTSLGRSIAHSYASRGAKLCILGISESELGQLGRECIHIYRENGFEKELRESRNYILLILINPNTPLEVSRIHSIVEAAWGGIDTIINCLALPPPRLPVVSMVSNPRESLFSAQVSGIQISSQFSPSVQESNVMSGGLAMSFAPLLRNSYSPSILIVSSLVTSPQSPTNFIYVPTPRASIHNFHTLSDDHPGIAFTFIIPTLFAGRFCLPNSHERYRRHPSANSLLSGSLLRIGMTRVQPPSNNPNVIVTNLGMSVDEVARRCVCAVDKGETFVLMPVWFSRTVRLLYWLFPQFVEGWATLKFMTL